MQGLVKVVISQGQISNLHKIGKYGIEIGGKIWAIINKIGKNQDPPHSQY